MRVCAGGCGRNSLKTLSHPEKLIGILKGFFRVQRRFSLNFSLRLASRSRIELVMDKGKGPEGVASGLFLCEKRNSIQTDIRSRKHGDAVQAGADHVAGALER